MKNIWNDLTPEERKVVTFLRGKLMEKREAEFYAIHGQKKGRPKNDSKPTSDVSEMSDSDSVIQSA